MTSQSRFRIFLLILGGGLLLTAAFAACQSFRPPIPAPDEVALATFTPTPTSTPTFTPTSTPTKTPTPSRTPTPTPAQSVEEKSARVTAVPVVPTATPDPRFRYVVSETEMNQALKKGLAQSQTIDIQNPYVDLKPGYIEAGGRVVLGFFPANLTLIFTVDVRDCRAEPQLDDVLVNGAPAPAFVRNQVEDMLAPYLAQLTEAGENACVESVEIGEENLIVQGEWR